MQDLQVQLRSVGDDASLTIACRICGAARMALSITRTRLSSLYHDCSTLLLMSSY
jgi:hypothetical protein